LVRLRRRAAQQYAQPVDGHAEAHHQQAGDDADEDGEQKEEAFLSGRRDRSGFLGRVVRCRSYLFLYLHGDSLYRFVLC
jgi:hypothetical protein